MSFYKAVSSQFFKIFLVCYNLEVKKLKKRDWNKRARYFPLLESRLPDYFLGTFTLAVTYWRRLREFSRLCLSRGPPPICSGLGIDEENIFFPIISCCFVLSNSFRAFGGKQQTNNKSVTETAWETNGKVEGFLTSQTAKINNREMSRNEL